jgi:hypothetical protein
MATAMDEVHSFVSHIASSIPGKGPHDTKSRQYGGTQHHPEKWECFFNARTRIKNSEGLQQKTAVSTFGVQSTKQW